MFALLKKLPCHSLLIVLLLGLASVAQAARPAQFLCKVTAMNKNKWICKENEPLCTFDFTVDWKNKTLIRETVGYTPRIGIVVDKWNDKVIIAHEDRPRVANLYLEQYFYKIELDTGKFLMANEFVTNSGRYLTQEDMRAAQPKGFFAHYYVPQLISQPGSCTFQ